MAVRIVNLTLSMAPIQRPDRSLIICFGFTPDSRRDDDVMFGTWALDYWPMRSGLVNDGLAQGNWPMCNRTVWVEDMRWSGVSSAAYRIVGIAKDQNGTPKGNCLARLYLTSDDTLVAQTRTADVTGEYAFQVPDNTTNYYVVVRQGAPAIAGVSIGTLTGAAP